MLLHLVNLGLANYGILLFLSADYALPITTLRLSKD
jgi:hypothetical protein